MSWKGYALAGLAVLLVILAPVTMGTFAHNLASGVVEFIKALFPHG